MPTEVNTLKSALGDGAAQEGASQEDGAVQQGAIFDGPAQEGAVLDQLAQESAESVETAQGRATSGNSAPHNPIRIDADTCVKCDLCDWICPGDLIYKKPDDRETLPEVRYPDECWYCGLCQSICPVDAITIIFPKQMIRCRTDVKTLLGKVVE